MNRVNKALVVAIVSALGLWGCANGSGNGTAERTKILEHKVAKLEEDFLAAAAARDQFRQKLEQEMAQLVLVVRERDELRQQVNVRTGERDTVQGQYDQFRSAIRELLGQAEAGASPLAAQSVAAFAGPLPGNS